MSPHTPNPMQGLHALEFQKLLHSGTSGIATEPWKVGTNAAEYCGASGNSGISHNLQLGHWQTQADPK